MNPTKKTFTGKLCLRMKKCLLITSLTDLSMNPLNSPETIFPRTSPRLQPFYTTKEAVELLNKVVASGKSNASGLKILVKSGMNIPAWTLLLKGYKHENLILDGLSYGWPLNWTCSPFLSCQTVKNHPTAEKQFPAQIKDWYLDQVERGMLVGPCQREDLLWANLTTSPLQSVVKDPIEMTRRVCETPPMFSQASPRVLDR